MSPRAWPAMVLRYFRERRGVAVVVAALVVLGLWALARSPGGGDEGKGAPTFEVRSGPLTISIAQGGTIRAMEQETITSEVEGQTTIIFLIEEGTRVSEGDLLVQLDDSALRDNLVEQQIRVQNAEASFIRAREGLAVTRSQADSDISLAGLKFQFAKEDLTQYVEGEYRQDLREADSTITLAEEQLQLADRKLEWSERLFREDYLSESERDTDRLARNRAQLDLELARAAKALLEDFTYKRDLAQLKSDVEQAQRALERAELTASANIVQAEADLKAREAEWHQQQGKEEKFEDQIAKTRMVAPRDGLVVYATSLQAGWRGNTDPLEEGQAVRERQELIFLPTADRMMAQIQVHESKLDQVRLGLPVVVTVDALKGKSFMGKVSRIAPLPDAASMWMNPDLKVYRTEVEIVGAQPELRTGMSCMAEIVVERYDEATYVPVQSVVRVGGRSTVFLRRRGRVSPVPVEVGMDNNRMIQILSGVEPGQQVLLAPPLREAAVADGTESVPGGVDPERLKTMIETANGVESPARRSTADPPAGEETAPAGREEMRRRMESMTPEERRALLKRFEGKRPGGGRRGGGAEGGT